MLSSHGSCAAGFQGRWAGNGRQDGTKLAEQAANEKNKTEKIKTKKQEKTELAKKMHASACRRMRQHPYPDRCGRQRELALCCGPAFMKASVGVELNPGERVLASPCFLFQGTHSSRPTPPDPHLLLPCLHPVPFYFVPVSFKKSSTGKAGPLPPAPSPSFSFFSFPCTPSPPPPRPTIAIQQRKGLLQCILSFSAAFHLDIQEPLKWLCGSKRSWWCPASLRRGSGGGVGLAEEGWVDKEKQRCTARRYLCVAKERPTRSGRWTAPQDGQERELTTTQEIRKT